LFYLSPAKHIESRVTHTGSRVTTNWVIGHSMSDHCRLCDQKHFCLPLHWQDWQ